MSAAAAGSSSDSKQLIRDTIVKPFVYGSVAIWQGKTAEEEKSHRWSVYVRGLDNEDLGYFIKRVVFTLHSSFTDAVRSIECAPGGVLFEVTEYGWGEFSVKIQIHFHDLREPPVTLMHPLKLFAHDGQMINKRPVVSETYDEFVFVRPNVAFAELLNGTPARQFNDHPLAPHFTTAVISDEGAKETEQLAQVQASVTERINDLRKRLLQVEQEIAVAAKPPGNKAAAH